MFTLTRHIFKVGLLNFTVLGKNNFTIGIHGHGWLFPTKLVKGYVIHSVNINIHTAIQSSTNMYINVA